MSKINTETRDKHRKRERERERERQTDRQSVKKRVSKGQTDRERETERKGGIQSLKFVGGLLNKSVFCPAVNVTHCCISLNFFLFS